MKDYILNKVVLKTGDSLDIVESSTLPLTEKLMYKVEHEKDKKDTSENVCKGLCKTIEKQRFFTYCK